ncbi:pilus assembly protein [Photobacterium lipolyticum]|uniref:Pilus assembly protein n=1 Tax=Photobacterium lipolyticum TaxID=266810 RepID=A0A2T3N4J4_9GAMM|nr:pilus assembly protein TadG-related protein [Photobacterium lipolyticum]PSW07401.1 pilus assembly protein [Photobacterium lipolyticum]
MATMMRKQRGSAGIYMALFLIPLFGAIFLALEGTRYIQKQNRLADGAEAAALAVTMANHGNTSSYEKDLAEKYIQAYVRNIKGISQLEVTSKEDQTTIPSSEGNIEKKYTQYKVTAKTNHNSWFSSFLIPSFSPIETVANQAVARNYPEILGDKFVDIVFVSDFSYSMNNNWGNGKTKIKVLTDAIKQISDEILVSTSDGNISQNRIGFVPFGLRTQIKNSAGKYFCESNVRYTDEYEKVNWQYWSIFTTDYIKKCSEDKNNCKKHNSLLKTQLQQQAKIVMNVYNNTNYRNWGTPDKPVFIDIKKTIENIFTPNIRTTRFNTAKNKLWDSSGLCSKHNSKKFWSIKLTSDPKQLEPIYNSMSPGGWTGGFQGIIKGAKVLHAGKPAQGSDKYSEYKRRLKLLLILTDGKEYPYNLLLPDLVENKMCEKIKEEFKDSDVPLHIGVIGIKFAASKESGYIDCVGEDNIIDVNEVDDLVETIKEQIKKSSQAEGVSKLHYRYTDEFIEN